MTDDSSGECPRCGHPLEAVRLIRPRADVSWLHVVALYGNGAIGIVSPQEKRAYFGPATWVGYEDPEELGLVAYPIDRLSVN